MKSVFEVDLWCDWFCSRLIAMLPSIIFFGSSLGLVLNGFDRHPSDFNYSQQHLEHNSREYQESHPGLLGQKRECYFCAMLPPSTNSSPFEPPNNLNYKPHEPFDETVVFCPGDALGAG